jgi:hypothetical protein
VHFIVGDVAILTKVHGVDDLVKAVWLIAIKVLGLTTMS